MYTDSGFTMHWTTQLSIDEKLSDGLKSQDAFTLKQQQQLWELYNSAAFVSWTQPDLPDSQSSSQPTEASLPQTLSSSLQSSPNESSGALASSPQAETAASAIDKRTRSKRRLVESPDHGRLSEKRARADTEVSPRRPRDPPSPQPPRPQNPPTRPTRLTRAVSTVSSAAQDSSSTSSGTSSVAQSLLRSHRPIENVVELFKKIEEKLEGRQEASQSIALNHAVFIFDIYVRASADEAVSRAVLKLTAFIWIQLYPRRQISLREYRDTSKRTGVEVRKLRNMVREMRVDGRLRQQLVECFGEGCVLWFGRIDEWFVSCHHIS